MKKLIILLVNTAIKGWFLTVIFCIALQNNWIPFSLSVPENDITYDMFVNIYFTIVYLIIMVIGVNAIFSSFITDNYIQENNPPKILDTKRNRCAKKEVTEMELQQLEIRAAHEAGHVVMANVLGIEIIESTISSRGNSGGHVICAMGPILTSEDLYKRVLILYAGLFAEKLLLKSVSNGCMGAEDADLEVANHCLKEYIILTDEEVSLAGMYCEKEKIDKKMIQLSREWACVTKSTLEKNMKKLNEEKEKLLNDYHGKKRD